VGVLQVDEHDDEGRAFCLVKVGEYLHTYDLEFDAVLDSYSELLWSDKTTECWGRLAFFLLPQRGRPF